jgi:hypothetical protein
MGFTFWGAKLVVTWWVGLVDGGVLVLETATLMVAYKNEDRYKTNNFRAAAEISKMQKQLVEHLCSRMCAQGLCFKPKQQIYTLLFTFFVTSCCINGKYV